MKSKDEMFIIDDAIRKENIKLKVEILEKNKEIERLNNIIKEIREYIEKAKFEFESSCIDYGVIYDIIQILNKGE